ncbi:MAG: leucine-rich repeat domain-containing protein, partial [Clostridia bacterium]|nr:leucine-rich repeat domain-containing protein [Clostridia bacterium]
MRKIFSILSAIVLVISLFAFGAFNFNVSANADTLTSGYFTYVLNDNEAVITDFNELIGGKITIPPTLDGYSVTKIEDKAFFECKRISEIIVPDSVTSIGNGAFADCKNLKSITLPDGITTINMGLFSECAKLDSVIIPDTVKTIGEMAFLGCEDLSKIVIPQGVISIGAAAFSECPSLEKISIPNSVQSIGESAFSYCIGLNNVEIGSGINTISKQMFYGCKGITDIVIPSNIKTVGNSAFDGCSNLTSIQLSKSVATIKSYAFDNCNKLSRVGYTGNNTDKISLSIELCNDALNDANWIYGICEPKAHNYNGDCISGCSVCGWTYSKHIYDYVCDAFCNICNNSRTVTHDYAEATCKVPMTCKICGITSGSKKAHTFKEVLTKATTSKNGKIENKCTVCGDVESTTTIKYAKTFSLSSTSYTYDGKT